MSGCCPGSTTRAVVAVADPAEQAAERLAATCGATAYADAGRAARRRGRGRRLRLRAAVRARRRRSGRCWPAACRCSWRSRWPPTWTPRPSWPPRSPSAGVVTGTGYHWRCLDTVERAAALLADAPRPARARRLAGQGAAAGLVGRPGRCPAARWSSSSPTCSTWPGCWSARSLEVTAAGSRHDDSPGDVDDVTAATVRFRGGAVGTFTASSLLPAKHTAGLRTVSPGGLLLDLSEQELVVERDGDRQVLTPAVDGHQAGRPRVRRRGAGPAGRDPGAVRGGAGHPPGRLRAGRPPWPPASRCAGRRGAGMTDRADPSRPGQGRAGARSRTSSWRTAGSGSPPRTPGCPRAPSCPGSRAPTRSWTGSSTASWACSRRASRPARTR